MCICNFGTVVCTTSVGSRALTDVAACGLLDLPSRPSVSCGFVASLPVYTNEKQRAVIRFLWSQGVSGAEIHKRLSKQYGDLFYHSAVYMDGSKKSKTVGQTLK